jgi:hypothetical protein
MRNRAVLLALSPGLLLTAGLATAPAHAADDPCLDPAALRVHQGLPDLDPVVVPAMPHMTPRTIDRQNWPVATYDVPSTGNIGLYVDDPDCTGVTVTVRPPTGPDRQVELNSFVEDFRGHFGSLYVAINDGGTWHFTEMRRGTTTVPLSPPRPFPVWLQSVVLLDHLPTVPAGRSVAVSGTAYDYTVDRVPVRSRNRSVVITSTDLAGNDHAGATVVTDAAGRFSATLKATETRVYRAKLAARAPYTADTDVTTAYVGTTGIQLSYALQVPAYRTPTSVTGRVTPGHRTVVLERARPEAFDFNIEWLPVATALAGTDGRFAISYRPDWKGPMRMRVRLTGTMIADEFETTTVNRTSLTGRTAPTNARQVHPGTKMSTYGHLKVTYDNGTSGAYADRQVVVQTRAQGVPGAAFTTVATARTSATGYYYANWTARDDVDVRVAFLSPFRTVGWSFLSTGQVDVI